MLRRTINFVQGHVTVSVESAFPERVLNLCAAHQIPFWDLKWESPIRFTFTMTGAAWRRLRREKQRLDARVEAERREGLPYFLRRFRRRYALVAGMVLAVLLSVAGSFFIWDFEIEGNRAVSDEEILRALQKCGVGLGTFGYGIRSDELRNRVLLELPELSYIAVNVRGCRAHVQVRERVEAPERVDKRRPGNTLAARDGLVVAVQPYDGKKLVLPGTTVREGQMLISGVVDDDQAGTRFLRGMGKVYARTWYDLRCQVPLTVREKVYTREETRFSVCWGSRRINFYNSSSIVPDNCDKITTRTKLTLPGGIALPVTVVKETWRYYEIREGTRGEEEARQLAETVLERYLLAGMDEGTVESRSFAAVPWEGGLLTSLTAECREQIGVFVEIPTEEE